MAITRIGTYAQIKGTSFKLPCVVATTASITLSGTQTIDGVAVVAGDRVLVKDQGGATNGIYIVASGAWSRAVDMSLDDDVFEGLMVYINSGSANGDKTFYLNTPNPITLGVTSLTFTAVPGGAAIGGTVTGGTAGSVLFVNPTATLAQDNANFFWDDTNNRLGLGTATPSYTLDIAGTLRTTSTINSEGTLNISKSGGTPRLEIQNQTASSTNKIEAVWIGPTGSGFGAIQKFTQSTTAYKIIAGSDFAMYNYLTYGDIAILNDNSTGKIKFAAGSSSTAQMTLTAAGRLLLGTTTESTYILDANGTGRFTGALTITAANSTATGGGQIYLNGATGNRIDFNANGVAAPAFTTRSAGTKLVLYPSVGAASVDYALGIESATMWFSVPDTVTSNTFKWYAGTTNILTLTGAGVMTLSRNQNATTNIEISNTTSGTASTSQLQLTSDSTSGSFSAFKTSTTYTTYKILVAKDAGFYNGTTGGDFSFLNDFATGKCKWAMGGSTTAQMTLTAAGRLLIGTTSENTSAILNVTSTTQGFLPPRMTTTEKNAIASPAAGLIVYDTTLNKLCVRTASAWETITSV